jgi:hypothetical protein
MKVKCFCPEMFFARYLLRESYIAVNEFNAHRLYTSDSNSLLQRANVSVSKTDRRLLSIDAAIYPNDDLCLSRETGI